MSRQTLALVLYLSIINYLSAEFYSFNRHENKLIKDKLGKYNRAITPIQPSKPFIQVRAKANIRYLYVSWKSDKAYVYMSWNLKWKDPQWAWKPEKYGKICDISVPSKMLWLPTFYPTFKTVSPWTFYNRRNKRKLVNDHTPCFISSNGDVQIKTTFFDAITCNTTNGYDLQCKLSFEQHDPNEDIKTEFSTNDVKLKRHKQEMWTLASKTFFIEQFKGPHGKRKFNRYTYVINMKQNANSKHQFYIIHPGVMLGLITTFQFLISPRLRVRNIINGLLLFLILEEMHFYVWAKEYVIYFGMLQYFTVLMCINIVALFWSILFSNIWLQAGTLTDKVSLIVMPWIESISKYFLMPLSDAKNRDAHDKFMMISLIADRLFFVISLLSVIIMIATLDKGVEQL